MQPVSYKDANGKTMSFQMTGTQLASALAKRVMVADTSNSMQTRDKKTGAITSDAVTVPVSGVVTTYIAQSLFGQSASPREQEITVGHEGLHWTTNEYDAAKHLYPGALHPTGEPDPSGDLHQKPYDHAGACLIGVLKCN